MNRLAILDDTAKTIGNQFLEVEPFEGGAFCLLYEGKAESGGRRLLVTKQIAPIAGAWESQDSGLLRPSAQWVSAATSHAIEAHSGLLFIHSHPDPRYPIGLSHSDRSSFLSLARTLSPMLDGPFAAAVVHPSGWTSVVWSDNSIVGVDNIVAISRTMRILDPIQEIDDSSLDCRQYDALGVVHHRLRRLSVAVVGCGGLGSPIAEQLVRMGIAELTLVDHDVLDTESNLRRNFGSKAADLRAPIPPPKVDVLARHLESLELGVQIHPINGDVRTEKVFRILLNSDLVINATDTHGSRAIVNELASTYMLPVIDVGVRVGSKTNGSLCGLLAEARILTPTTPCLWCRGTISSDVIRVENLPKRERQELAKSGYVVQGIGSPVPSVVALTILGSGLATCAMLALLSDEGEIVPSGYWIDGFHGDSHETQPELPKDGCRCQQHVGLGDCAPPPFMQLE